MIFVTGGAGFIGSNFILHLLKGHQESVLNIDKLTYAGNPQNLESLNGDLRYQLAKVDIKNQAAIDELFAKHRPRALVHFAAESHVDRSILGPREFIETNVLGTFVLLDAALKYWKSLAGEEKSNFRFLHVSTDEVYGSLNPEDPAFCETTAFAPNSPYAASKAGSDHLVRAYFHTYGLPVVTTNCSNNYGPLQFPEKLIPLMIHNALTGKKLPIYGNGLNVRDWLYVVDHCEALLAVLARGRLGETYNVGGKNEKTNIQVVDLICQTLDKLRPRKDGKSYFEQKTFVEDRLGHDKRYAIDPKKIESEIGWIPKETFESGLRKTIEWYLDHETWVSSVTSGEYVRWIEGRYVG